MIIGGYCLYYKYCRFCEFDGENEFCNYGTKNSLISILYQPDIELFATGLDHVMDNIEFCGLLWEVDND